MTRLRVIQGGASLRADHLGRVLAARYAERSEVPVRWERESKADPMPAWFAWTLIYVTCALIGFLAGRVF